MNPIDRMLLAHANKIEICIVTNPNYFIVRFANFPSEESLAPLLALVESGRFDFCCVTKIYLEKKKITELLEFRIDCVNVIPAVKAVKALYLSWQEMGYDVTIKATGSAKVSDVLERICLND